MPLTEPRTLRWTKDQYHRLAELGWLGKGTFMISEL